LARQLVAQVAAVLSIGAGVIHVSAAGDHTNLPLMFAGFIVVAALQVGLGVLLLRGQPSRALIVAALGLMLGSLGVWLVSRTAGLPFLDDGHTEPVGFKDGVTVLFELASVPALLLLLSKDLARVSLPSSRLRSQTLGVLGVACFALVPPALLLDGGGHHSHEQAVELGIHDDGHGEGDELTHVGPDASHSDGGDDQHARRDGSDRAHGHGKDSAEADGAHAHSGAELASAPLGTSHEHQGSETPGDEPKHHADENGRGNHGDRPHHRGGRHGDKPHDDGHGGERDGDGDGSDDDQPVTISYGPEPSVCVTGLCFP
jgi:hypothetical protein